MSKTFKVIVLIVIWGAATLWSDEGMWLPHQIQDLNLQELGLELEPGELLKEDGSGLMNAIVRLNGATGEFVSPQGLILTNHHVAYGAIRRASDAQHDYLKNGFVAQSSEEEIQALGQTASVLLGYEDVTQTIKAAVTPGMSYRERYEAIDLVKKRLVTEAEAAAPDLRAEVRAMYSGLQYYLFTYKRLLDVRLVLAPPDDLGRFGGEIDNWTWPRHTCDFTFLRAYVSPEGVGVPYDEANVPYQPKSFLKLSLEGVQSDDFTFVMGYPGRTYRNYTSKLFELEVEDMRERLSLFADFMEFYESASETSREVEIKYASTLRGLANASKNYRGKLEGFQRIDVLEKKQQQEKAFLQWAQENASMDYSQALEAYHTFLEEFDRFQDQQSQVERLVSSWGTAPALLSQAYLIYRTVHERAKPDAEREVGYQERDLEDIQRRIELADRSYDFETDKQLFKFVLTRLLDAEPASIPNALNDIITTGSTETIHDFVEELYETTLLNSTAYRLELLEKTPQELQAIGDPMIDLAAEFETQLQTLREQEKALQQENRELKAVIMQGLLDYHDGRLAPDANSTLRFTYGTVQGYSPRDAIVYEPVTTLTGVLEKDTDEFPFDVSDKIKTLYKAQDFGPYVDPDEQDIVTCFLNTTNVTGGNSGSPTLNARGEQIGIIFDMTYESVIGDYYIVPEWQRTISVDIRYVLFVVDQFSGATWLVEELGLE